MSLYDDLGVAKGATPEEIRAAHRALARLLHPDRIQDAVTRQVAETTLKKINVAFAVLSDSRRRMEYDRELERELDRAGAFVAAERAAAGRAGAGPGAGAGGWRRWVEKRANWDWAKRNALWGAGTVVGLTVIYLALWQGAPAARPVVGEVMPVAGGEAAAKGGGKSAAARGESARRGAARREAARGEAAHGAGSTGGVVGREVAVEPRVEERPGEQGTAGAREVAESRGSGRGKSGSREAGRGAEDGRKTAVARVVKMPGEIVYLPLPQAKKPVWIAPPEVKRAEAEMIAPPEMVGQVATPLPAVVRPGMAGLWVYVRPSQVAGGRNSYPPEFIELSLRESGGVVKGRYLARYQVADRAISPEVRFQFEGAAGEEAGEFVWSGNGGAKGEVRLRRVGDHQMQVSWHTTEVGAEAGLVSGTAVLIRRQTP